jgi:glycine oxidase
VSADVIVVGGGIIGCAIARELARRGARVRLIAREVAGGASHASAGMLAPYTEAHERGPLFDLTLRSLALYDDFVASAVADSSTPIDYRRCGSLEVADDDASAEVLFTRARAGAADGLEWLTRDHARQLEPALPETIAGALHAPMHGYVAVPSLVESLAWAALHRSAEIESGHPIRAVRRAENGWTLTTDDGMSWAAEWVVMAAGSWTSQISGLPGLTRSIRPIRGQLIRLKWRDGPLRTVLWGKDCYVVPWQDGTVLVGATVEDVGFDERTTAAGVRDLLDAACELLPGAWGATFLEARAGLRPATDDGLPIIGALASAPGLVFATGHYRNGVLLAPLTAQAVAELILEGRSDPALELTAPDGSG